MLGSSYKRFGTGSVYSTNIATTVRVHRGAIGARRSIHTYDARRDDAREDGTQRWHAEMRRRDARRGARRDAMQREIQQRDAERIQARPRPMCDDTSSTATIVKYYREE